MGFQRGLCQFGDNCRYSHSPNATSTIRDEICRSFQRGTCSFGDACRYSHGQVAGAKPVAPALGAGLDPEGSWRILEQTYMAQGVTPEEWKEFQLQVDRSCAQQGMVRGQWAAAFLASLSQDGAPKEDPLARQRQEAAAAAERDLLKQMHD